MRLRSPNNLYFGLFLILVGIVGLRLVGDLRLGSAVRMGPGYMPTLLCWVLIGLGALNGARAFAVAAEPTGPWNVKALVLVSAAVGAFGLAITPLGLATAVLLVVFIASLAHPEARLGHSVALGVGLGAFCVGVFIVGLGLPMQIWPSGLR
jgi:putative tricarboxylic transport membrane protein